MKHVMKITMKPGDGLNAELVCVETGRCTGDDGMCGYVEAYSWDSAASLEGFHGLPVEVFTGEVNITGIDEMTFDWEFGAPVAGVLA